MSTPPSHSSNTDRTLFIGSIVTAALFSCSIPLYSSLFQPEMQLLFFTVPPFILITLKITQEQELKQIARKIKAHKEKKQREQKKLFFRSWVAPGEEGTVWRITNSNNYSWSNVKILIERSFGGNSQTEKFSFGNIKETQEVTLHSSIRNIPTARWRILVISNEGWMIEFPDKLSKEDIIGAIKKELRKEQEGQEEISPIKNGILVGDI